MQSDIALYCLSELFKTQYRHQKTSLGVLVNESDASAPSIVRTSLLDFLASSGIQLVKNRSSHPDHPLCDFHPFLKIEEDPMGLRLRSHDEVRTTYFDCQEPHLRAQAGQLSKTFYSFILSEETISVCILG